MAFAATSSRMLLLGLSMVACQSGSGSETSTPDERVAAIHENHVFADIHAHPSRFHRANIEKIEPEELAVYQRGNIDLVVANISSDAAFHGGYTKPDGSTVDRLRGDEVYPLEPGDGFAFLLGRLALIEKTVSDGDAVLAVSPDAVLEAKRQGKISIMAALEGADGVEGSLDNLREIHRRGVRLVQLIHFLNNDLGHKQTEPYYDEGLTELGHEFIREANRLGIIVDMAHANTPTLMDALEVSSQPVLFSHTGAKALHDGARYITDEEIKAIAAHGGVIGIWPAKALGDISAMVAHISHVRDLVGNDHLAIASDLRGMDYIPEFGDEANFRAIVDALMDAGYSNEEIGKVMGGNFFRLWQQVASAAGDA